MQSPASFGVKKLKFPDRENWKNKQDPVKYHTDNTNRQRHARELAISSRQCQFQHTLPTSRTAYAEKQYGENRIEDCGKSSSNIYADSDVALDLEKCVVLEEEAQFNEP
ncbi:hypothetical protein J1614_010800 [Plenodomus biglobosus]|nr:hypothetical protein J1614_010800 [Plenodomus biglobosus]